MKYYIVILIIILHKNSKKLEGNYKISYNMADDFQEYLFINISSYSDFSIYMSFFSNEQNLPSATYKLFPYFQSILKNYKNYHL